MSDLEVLDENDNVINNNSKKRARTIERNESVSFSNIKQTIFEYNSDQIYELLLQHGLSKLICEKFLDEGVNGMVLSDWSKLLEQNELEKELKNKSFILSDQEVKHLSAILSRYKRDPFATKNKIICDSVHDQVSLHPLLVQIIDTPQFQRLRYLKQLGPTVYVYPSATHTRFEHSIGTSYIAGKLIRHLRKSQPSLKITNADELCVMIAGLCHDLGHGPFSHMFEEVIERLDENSKWKHEMATLELIDKMLKETDNLRQAFESFGLFENDIQLIKDLIYAEVFKKSDNQEMSYRQKLETLGSLKARGLEKSFLFEIVSNYRNGIDVDKFDYFGRDCRQSKFSNNFNYKRYIKRTRVIKIDGINQICVRDKELVNLYEMFHVREYLTRRVYKHEKVSAINLMIIDALVKANEYFKFTSMISTLNYNQFENLNDCIIQQILYSNDEKLIESKLILQRLHARKLYKYIGSFVLPTELHKKVNSLIEELRKHIVEAKEYVIKDETSLVFETVRFNYGSKNLNPVDSVWCYNKYSPDSAFKIPKEKISRMLLNEFEDVVIRLYYKENDLELFEIYNRFKSWCQTKNYDLNVSQGSNF